MSLRFRLPALSAALALAACTGDPALYVDLRSDFVPGVEVTRAVTFVRRDGVVAGMGDASLLGLDLVTGARIAEIPRLPRGSYIVTVDLQAPEGTTVYSRRILLELTETYALTVTAQRACRGVVCPGAGEPADATECLDGMCVPPSCVGHEAGCPPPVCSAALDCPGGLAACAVPVCADGSCLLGVVAGSCGSDEACVPEVGCVPRDDVADAGPRPDGSTPGTDASGTDAGPTIDGGPPGCPGECMSGTGDSEDEGCGDCGTHSRSRSCGPDCRWGSWGSWGSCSGEGRCTPGDRGSFPCGMCGTWTCTCQDNCNDWAACGSCTGDVSCSGLSGRTCAGDTGYRTCTTGGMPGAQECTCSSSGTWVSCGSCIPE